MSIFGAIRDGVFWLYVCPLWLYVCPWQFFSLKTHFSILYERRQLVIRNKLSFF